ncbi:MAG: hypothetical protein F9K46_01270 [Anaerolineae bacterium]|nr:MAG: hypothetical protein F9K46_01270 [Anaerolineae bacterium]
MPDHYWEGTGPSPANYKRQSVKRGHELSSSPIKFYLDSHIDKEVAAQLRNKCVDVIHCAEVGMQDASDLDHLLYATQNGRILVTCDAGIEYQLHYDWLVEGREHAGIAYFNAADDCKSISIIISELLFLFEAADYEADLYNQFWRRIR